MKYVILFFILLSINCSATQVKDNNCKSPLSSTGIALMDDMFNNMGVDPNSIDKEKIRTELLYNEPVSEALARHYALERYRANPDKWLSVKDYMNIYSESHPENLIIKFSIRNKTGQENIFLVSAIANDYECGVRYNGYIIVKREF